MGRTGSSSACTNSHLMPPGRQQTRTERIGDAWGRIVMRCVSSVPHRHEVDRKSSGGKTTQPMTGAHKRQTREIDTHGVHYDTAKAKVAEQLSRMERACVSIATAVSNRKEHYAANLPSLCNSHFSLTRQSA